MFLSKLFGKKRDKPEFHALRIFPEKDSYFYRVAAWDWLNQKQIVVYDPQGPRVITMDDWPQMIFLEADGQLTVSEYTEHISTLYRSVPNSIDETIIYQLNSLIDLKIIAYSEIVRKPDSKFDIPLAQQKHDS